MQRYRHLFTHRNLMMIGMPSATAAFCFWAQGNSGSTRWNAPLESFNKLSTTPGRRHALSNTPLASASVNEDIKTDSDDFTRSFRTQADIFYAENKKIPLPSILHATLAELLEAQESKTDNKDEIQKNILVIGDVHGCYDELLDLHAKAVQENNLMPFQYVILVGDLW